MQEIVCKNCNAPLNTGEAKNGVVVCPFCQSVYTLPKKEQPAAVMRALNAGAAALDVCRFNEAYEQFSRAVEGDPTEPEGYFGRALARFRVQYLKDTVNNRMQPICHEMSESVFTKHKDYIKALECATEEQKEAYRAKGEEIDHIREEFYALGETGLDYDCFICVKVTDERGRPTSDSADATRIYMSLQNSGYKPFYSEFEIGKRTGADYEAMILYALYMSECMLIVCSEEEYLETKWVKNEYGRFLSMVGDERKERNSVAVAFRGKPIERLPGVKGKLQGVDLAEMDAMDRIRGFIDGHDAEKQRKKREREAAERAEKEREAAEEENRRRKEAEEIRRAAEQAAKEREEAERRRAEEAEKRAAEMEKRLKELEAFAKRAAAEAAPAVRQEPAVKQAPVPAKQAAKPAETAKQAPVSPAPAKQTVKPAEAAPAVRQEPAKQAAKPAEAAKQAPVSPAPAKQTVKLVETAPSVKQAPAPAIQASPLTDFQIKDGVLIKYKGKGGDVVIPEGLKEIGEKSFRSCKTLTSVLIPEGVTKIGSNAFSFCDSLQSVVIPEGITKIGDDAFFFCKSLTSVVIPEGVTEIGSSAFNNCNSLTSVVIPEGVTEIGDAAFWKCESLTSVVIPASVSSLGYGLFSGCINLQEVKVSEKNKNYRVENNCLIDVRTNAVVSGWGTNIVIPKGVTEIGAVAFENCKSLKSIVIPKGITKIGSGAFSFCDSLQSVVIPEGVTKIGYQAFYGCSCLKSVVIPKGVKGIVREAFEACTSLKKVTIPASVETIGEYAFGYKNFIVKEFYDIEITVLDEEPQSGKKPGWDSEWKGEKAKVIWQGKQAATPSAAGLASPAPAVRQEPAKQAAKPAEAAKQAPAPVIQASPLTDFQIEHGVLIKYTGKGGDVVIPKGVKEIKYKVFCGCKSLTSVVIPKGVTKIEEKAFCECKSLTSVVIPEGVTKIEYNAFDGCTSLKSIVIPEGVTEIKSRAFEYCKSLTSVVLPKGVTKIGAWAFHECGSLTSVIIPEGVIKIGFDAFKGCKSLTSVAIPDGVKEIGTSAFEGCTSLKKVTIPASVKKIEKYAFGYKRTFLYGNHDEFFYDVEITVLDKKPLLGKKLGWDSEWKGEKAKVIWRGKPN